MQSESSLSSTQRRLAVGAGLLAMAAVQPALAEYTENDLYTWSAELVAVDESEHTVTVQSRLVGNADVSSDSLDGGDRVTLTWSGINTAAGVRRIVDGAAPDDDRLTLPIEFVSAQHDNQYVRFKVPVPNEDFERIASLEPGTWITATSLRRGASFEEAVADVRPYNDVG